MWMAVLVGLGIFTLVFSLGLALSLLIVPKLSLQVGESARRASIALGAPLTTESKGRYTNLLEEARREAQHEEDAMPLIGKGGHIPWTAIEGYVFRITHFTPFAHLEGDRVVSAPAPMPYGVLTVESPILNQPAMMPVNHREEFRNLWEFQALIGSKDDELLVSYLPASGFFAWLALMRLFGPHLHLRIRPRGELERYYAEDRHWRKPSAREVFFTSDKCLYCGRRTYRFSVRCVNCKRAIMD